jgi:hypothetical protein
MTSAPSLTAAPAAARAPTAVPPSSLVMSWTEGSLSSNSAISAACFMLLATAAVSPMPPMGSNKAIFTGLRLACSAASGAVIEAVGVGVLPMLVEQAAIVSAANTSAMTRHAGAPPCLAC